jgi:hypothetical protein
MPEGSWTLRLVAERLEGAADVLDRLPPERHRTRHSSWPRVIPPADAIVRSGERSRTPAPSAEAIDRMDEALGWLGWLEPDERRIVWMRAEGLPWKRITHRLGIGRTTAWHRWTTALLKITTRLNVTREQNRPNNKHLNRSTGSVLQRR